MIATRHCLLVVSMPLSKAEELLCENNNEAELFVNRISIAKSDGKLRIEGFN